MARSQAPVGGEIMLWFKHFADAHRDEKLRRVRSKHGWEGYGRYWAILELIAEKVKDADTPPEIELSWQEWRSTLGINAQKLNSFSRTLEELDLLSTETSEELLKFSCPKLLKLSMKDLGRRRTDRGQQADSPPLEEKRIEQKRKDKKKNPNHLELRRLFHELNSENWLSGSNSFSDFKATCGVLLDGGMDLSQIDSAWVRYAWANEFNTSDDGATSFLKLFKNAMNLDDAATWVEMPTDRLQAIRREFSNKNTNGSKMGTQRSFEWAGDTLGEDGNKARPARIKEPSATSQGEEPDLKPAIEIVSKAQAFLTEKFPEVNGAFKFDIQPNYVILKFASQKKMPLPFLSADFDKKIRAYCSGFEKIVSGEIGIKEFKATLKVKE